MIPYGRHFLDEEDISAVVQVLREGVLTQGRYVEAFESKIAEYVGAKYAVAVSSGTAALHLCSIVADLRPGKLLATTPISFVATANAAQYVGADVVFSDIDLGTANLSLADLALVLDRYTDVRVVAPVHFAGLPCDMAEIQKLTKDLDVMLIEDGAHALGATYADGSMVGCCAYSHMTIFSLHPVKAIAAGEGGVITTNDESLYRRLLRLRSHGINKLDDLFINKKNSCTDLISNPWYYEMQELGYHYRITDIQCALALSQLNKINKFMARRKVLAGRYDEAFKNISWLKPIQLGMRMQSANHLYVLMIDFSQLSISRAEVMNRLLKSGIGTQVHYMPIPMHPFYEKAGYTLDSCPMAVEYYKHALTIPLFYGLTNSEQDFIIAEISKLAS
jgi:UDP-4-amino-4,6-dideoxy-N-acetyl-beta-L-altrosamine transaminase